LEKRTKVNVENDKDVNGEMKMKRWNFEEFREGSS
jgi:hypothetical protein